MRASASEILSMDVAYEQRTWPSPQAPKAEPGIRATCSAFKSSSANSSEV